MGCEQYQIPRSKIKIRVSKAIGGAISHGRSKYDANSLMYERAIWLGSSNMAWELYNENNSPP